MKFRKLDYAKKKFEPGDYEIILKHCRDGWSFPSANCKVHMSSGNFYKAILGDKIVDEIRKTYCYKNRQGKDEGNNT